jgi:hypothetical protein
MSWEGRGASPAGGGTRQADLDHRDRQEQQKENEEQTGVAIVTHLSPSFLPAHLRLSGQIMLATRQVVDRNAEPGSDVLAGWPPPAVAWGSGSPIDDPGPPRLVSMCPMRRGRGSRPRERDAKNDACDATKAVGGGVGTIMIITLWVAAHHLVLITCSGQWQPEVRSYDSNLVGVADPVVG